MILKCRNCRHDLTTNAPLTYISAHGDVDSSFQFRTCGLEYLDTSWYINEASIPWILEEVNKSQWTKGRLNCPQCGSRVGGFDFVSRSKCSCGTNVLPAVHLVRSKVDHHLVVETPAD